MSNTAQDVGRESVLMDTDLMIEALEMAGYAVFDAAQIMAAEYAAMTPEERERMEADLATREERWN